MSASDWAILGVLAVLWGCAFFFLGLALRELPPFTIVLVRVGGAAVILLAYAALARVPLPGKRLWPSFVVLALLNNVVPFVLYGYGQQRIASGLASILNATTPLWGVIVAHIFTTDERATPGKVAGVLLGLAGVATMVGGDALAGLGGNVVGQGACLIATLCYALAGVYARRYQAQGVGPLSVATGQLIAATIVMIPLAVIVDMPWTLPMPGATTWWALAGMVVLCTVIAYVLYFRLLESAGASNSLLVTFLIPVTAILLGTYVLGEALRPKHFAGMALIALGLAAIDGRPISTLRGRLRRSI
ncbi:MAG: DMT family transporter [Sphingomonadaceae bacterium]|nr:DMT family transporter [Sphingomonadaceae bacterium]